jgi:hypothetical protein
MLYAKRNINTSIDHPATARNSSIRAFQGTKQVVQHFLVMENASCSISADWQKLTQILNLQTKLA